MGTLGCSSTELLSTITTESWFEFRSFFTRPETSPRTSYYQRLIGPHQSTPYSTNLKNPSLISSYNSPTLALTTFPTTILIPLPLYLLCVEGGCREEALKIGVFVVTWEYHRRVGYCSISSVWLFFRFLIKQKSKPKKQDFMQTYIFIEIDNSVRQLAYSPA